MASSAELLKRLDGDGEPLAKRLRLAQNVFQSSQIPVQRKEEAVITWICKVAGKVRKQSKRESGSRFPEDDILQLWSTLQMCVASQHMQQLGVADIRPSIMTCIVKVLSKHLERENLSKVEIISVLECALSILEANSFRRYFRTNIQLCMDFASLVLCSLAQLGVDHVQLCIRGVSSIQYISRQIISRNDLCQAFLDTTLFPLIKLMKVHGYHPSPLTSEIYKCIQQVLFPKTSSDFSRFFLELFKERKNIVDPTADLPCSKDQHPVPFCLIRVLMESKDFLDNDAYVSLFSTVFRAFVATYKTNPGPLIFQMAVMMSYIVGFDLNRPKLCKVPYAKLRECVAKPAVKLSPLSLGVLQGMTVILHQWRISINSEICGSSFLSWLQLIVETIFPLPARIAAGVPFMELISTLIKLNPMIVEPNIKDILTAVTIKPLSDEEKPVYTTLITAILSMYMKLSRVSNFTTVFLTCLYDGLRMQHLGDGTLQEDMVWLPPKFRENLTKYATIMPSSSSIATLNVLLDRLSKDCLDIYETFVDRQLMDSQNPFIDLHLKCVSELLCAYLKGVRMLEQCQTSQARQGYCLIMKLLSEQLRRFGRILSKKTKINSPLFSSFLNIAYHWAAEALLIEQYADIGRDELLASLGTNLREGSEMSNQDGSLSYLHPYLHNSEWENLRGKLVKGEHRSCEDLLLNLDLQLLAALRMFDSSQSIAPQEVADRACQQMALKLTISPRASVNQTTVSDVILMAPLLKGSELTNLCGSLTARLLICEEYESRDIILSLIEERSVACGLICSVLSSLKQCVKACKRKRDDHGGKQWKTSRAVLAKLDSELIILVETRGLSESCEKLKPMVSSMTAIVDKAVSSLLDGEIYIAGEEMDLTNITQHLHFLRSLPLAYLSPGSQVVVFLSMLSMALDCFYLCSSHLKDSILKDIFDHLLLGLYERGVRFGPSFEGFIDQGVLVNCLAYVVTNFNVGRRLLELMLAKALREEQSQDQVLKKVCLLSKKSHRLAPGKENLLLGTMLLQDLAGQRLRVSGIESVNILKKARKKLASSFEALIQKELVTPEETLHAFGLTLDFNLKFDNGVENLTPHLDKFCKTAISFLAGGDCAQKSAAETLITTVFHHSKKLIGSIPPSLMKDVWSLLTSSVKLNRDLLTAVYESASPEEILFIITDLLHRTRKVYSDEIQEGEACLSNLPTIMHFWQVLLKCQNLPAANHETCWRAIRSVLEYSPLTKKLPQKHLFEFLQAVLATTKVPMDMEMVDLCLSLLNEISLPNNEFTPVAEQYLSVLSALLLYRTSLALDCIPSFLQKLQHLIKQLANESKQRPELTRADGARLAGLAFGVEKLVFALTKPDIKKSFQRVAAYFLADIILVFETVTLCAPVKVHFQNMVFALLSIIDEYALKFLLRTLSPASTEVFKSLYDTYKKYHRFSGRV